MRNQYILVSLVLVVGRAGRRGERDTGDSEGDPVTDDASLASSVGEIRAKIDFLRRLNTEHGFGVIIEDQATPLERIPELPPGVTEVFDIFRRLAGTYFCFVQPSEIASRTAG